MMAKGPRTSSPRSRGRAETQENRDGWGKILWVLKWGLWVKPQGVQGKKEQGS